MFSETVGADPPAKEFEPVKVGGAVDDGLLDVVVGPDSKSGGACVGVVTNVGKGVPDTLGTNAAGDEGEFGLPPEDDPGLPPEEELGLPPEDEFGLLGFDGGFWLGKEFEGGICVG